MIIAVVLHRDLSRFRAPVDRQQIQIRRRCMMRLTIDPPPRSWWDACTFGSFDRTPRLKLAGALEVFRSTYILAGVDDALRLAL